MRRLKSIEAAALTLLLLVLSSFLHELRVEGRVLMQRSSSESGEDSAASQEMPTDRKSPYKKVGSSFRRIPPSSSNPIQNK
ncbi:hypothetical protein BT93_J1770 [Corymbia citriodora subsp. variegata]|nr:hypothetical protein BT93_J1770 [Corymbia citriodora subsp. variegata]